ncbi:DUF503 domain-containing protein [Phototrophicus methaneseepsis]|uniref:DUF503 domain-containing protein n=1 Tax=Phototrophicus methaneseepsis TaxID=2710758 RepID=A0A7S8E686_9CHLR|nr:DUF503 domain-containing protein [Phototrophicus methaneseepsis]QPC81137.1 DUF503 domain-containing protein [Phototrophicus methaneseepsis]
MAKAIIGLCELEFYLPDSMSLKDKRSIVKSLLKRVHQQFNVAASETDLLDSVQSAKIAIVSVSNSNRHLQSMMQNVISWIESHYPQAMIVQENIETLY